MKSLAIPMIFQATRGSSFINSLGVGGTYYCVLILNLQSQSMMPKYSPGLVLHLYAWYLTDLNLPPVMITLRWDPF